MLRGVSNDQVFQMTQNISEEEELLRKRARRRLLGATTLVISAVIILPMIFDEEPKLEQQEMEINFSPDEYVTDFSPTLLDSDDLLVADRSSEVSTEESLSVETVAPPFVDEDIAELIVEQNRIPIPGTKPSYIKIVSDDSPITSHASAASGRLEFVVQLGAFSDHSKARQQQQNLVSNGVIAYTETLYVNNKEMMRVRVGPFSSRISAENELRKLNQFGLNGVVTAR